MKELPVCKNCNLNKGDHNGENSCPLGSKTRIGYIHFQSNQKFKAKIATKRQQKGFDALEVLYQDLKDNIHRVDWKGLSNVVTPKYKAQCEEIKKCVSYDLIKWYLNTTYPLF